MRRTSHEHHRLVHRLCYCRGPRAHAEDLVMGSLRLTAILLALILIWSVQPSVAYFEDGSFQITGCIPMQLCR